MMVMNSSVRISSCLWFGGVDEVVVVVVWVVELDVVLVCVDVCCGGLVWVCDVDWVMVVFCVLCFGWCL